VQASFRDPGGHCCLIGGRVLRLANAESTAILEEFLKTKTAQKFTAGRQLVSTRRLNGEETAALANLPELSALMAAMAGCTVYEHERIPFPSYPYEWPPELLWEAGHLTIELARAALAEGWVLKDATPYNVLVRGNEAVFIDVLSFERWEKGDAIWKPYAQFVRTFLLPLFVNNRKGLKLTDIFLGRRDGLEPEEVYRLCGPLERLAPRTLPLVTIPAWLSSKKTSPHSNLYQPARLQDPAKATFILDSLFNRLQRTLNWLKPASASKTTWSDYMRTHSYNEPAFKAKEAFVSAALQKHQPARVLDVGANTGHFSALAAQAGAAVVAVDYDPGCVGRVWQRAREKQLNILPLVVDLSRPSPAMGWGNGETPSFLERATGSFECVLMLAVIHHLLVTERVPLEEILRLAARLTTSIAVIEFVAPQDEMFRTLTRGRDHLHASLNEQVFETACARHFDIVESLALPGTHRKIYCLRLKKSNP
jgi:SAM-dependent methyltransferase